MENRLALCERTRPRYGVGALVGTDGRVSRRQSGCQLVEIEIIFCEIAGTDERYNQLGENPHGFLGYSSDGRMYAILVAGDRIKPYEEAPTDEKG